ncbi:MAG: transposase domain-containing protein [Saprospiraceae bacterium]|nr:transposase domain-containing protein [Saprospiraceae bacterium]
MQVLRIRLKGLQWCIPCLQPANYMTINPYDWLTDVFHRIKDHPINRIAELLPQNWNKATVHTKVGEVLA